MHLFLMELNHPDAESPDQKGEMSSPINSTTPTVQPSIPTLTCELCRQRKVKCDKLNPCTNCQKAGIKCEAVRRRRLPRGRHINKSTGLSHGLHLQNKIDRLEALVNVALAGPSNASSSNTPGAIRSSQGSVSERSSGAGSNTTKNNGSGAPHFWANVLEEVHGPQDFTSELEGESRGNEVVSATENEPQSTFTGFIFGSTPFRSLSLRPTPAVTTALCNIYLDQVDRIIKILHRPSLRSHLLHGKPYSAAKSSMKAENALDSSVFYAAVASMTDRQCRSLFRCEKKAVLPEYQKACEISLEKADLTRTRDITVLQAFVLYLVATRAHDKSRAVWTLVATAVRLAHALNLHVDSDHPSETFFERQMRKRLWSTICLLDIQTCIDPDSKPLVPFEVAQTAGPLNLNDSDLDQSYQGREPKERVDVTDVTFSLITHKLQILGRSMHLIRLRKNFEPTREELVKAFEDDVYELTKTCNPDNNTYSWFVYHGSRSLVASVRLFTLGPTTENPPSSRMSCSVLELCANAIENVSRMHSDERGEGFRWYVTPQWPAVALAIRECCVSTDYATIRRTWPLIEEVFERYKRANPSLHGRPRTEMLRQLMDNARERVRMLLASESEKNISTSEDLALSAEEVSPEIQATDLPSPSWDAWESFMAELSLGQLSHNEPHDMNDNYFIKPDLVFPFG